MPLIGKGSKSHFLKGVDDGKSFECHDLFIYSTFGSISQAA